MLELMVCLYFYEESGDAGSWSVSTSMRSLVMLGFMVCLYFYEESGDAEAHGLSLLL